MKGDAEMSEVHYRKKSMLILLACCMSVALFMFPFVTIYPARAAEEPVTLRVGWTAEPDSLSPFISNRIVTFELHLLLYDTLVAYDNEVKPTGRLAKEWKVSDDHLSWTFKLAEGVKWHDGQPFTSEDVKFTYESLMKAQTGMYSDFLKGITSIETPDPLTVIIKTDKPKANMLQVTAPILPKHIWSNVKFDDLKTWPNDKPIGTGAFKFVEWKKGEYVKLEANKDYFLGAPKIDQLIFPLYANNDTMVQSLKIGEIDGAININPNQVKLLQSEKNMMVVSNPGNHFTDLAINVWKDPKSKGNPLLLKNEVRKAMEYAIDKQTLIDVAYSGQARIGTTLVPSVFANWHYEPQGEELRSYNPDKAKQLLEAAGFTDTNGDGIREDAKGKKLEFRLYLRGGTAEEVKAGQMISAMYKAVGIGTKVETMDDGVLTDKIYDNADFDLFIWGWGTDVDPTTILSVVSTEQIGNLSETYYSNPQYDNMLIEQGAMIDQAAREKMVKDMQKMVYEDVPYIILLEDHSMQAVRTDKWEGWKPIGGMIFQGYNHYNYLYVTPKLAPAANQTSSDASPATATSSASPTTKQSSNHTMLIWGGMAIAVIAIAGVLVARKRKNTDDFDQD
jgi:peptide/nickel transport system substrate-binding protein